MADKSNDISVKLMAGQQKMERNIEKIERNVEKIERDMTDLKTDVTDLKEGQNRVERFLLNLENIIMPKINAMYENSISNKQQIKKLEEAESKNAQKLDNHELRITRLEQSSQ